MNMSSWKTALKFVGKPLMAAGKSVGEAVIHPQRTLHGFGVAAKTAVVGGGMGYLAWENIVHDKPVLRTIGDTLVGEEAVEKMDEALDRTAERVESMTEKAGEAIGSMNATMTDIGNKWNGMQHFLTNVAGGNSMEMFGNFFNNLGKGNVSGISLLGLVTSSLLVFGRFGWLGKIAGAVLGMMLIGNNAHVAHGQTPQKGHARTEQSTLQAGGMRR